jgi:hypothetical protein
MTRASTARLRRDIAGLVLAGLASFLAASAAIPGWPIAGHSPQAPLDERQSVTLAASGASYLSPITLDEVTGAHLTVTETITGATGTGNSSIAIWTVHTAMYDTTRHQQLEPESRTLVFSRRSAELVNCCDENINGNGLIRQNGIAGYAFPVGARKQTYHIFDDVLYSPEPVGYSGTGRVDGIPVYRYTENISAAAAGYSPVSSTDPQRYSVRRVYSVDPETGAVLAVRDDEDLYLAKIRTRSPVTHLLDASLRTTPATVAMLARQDASVRHTVAMASRIRVAFVLAAAVLAVVAGFLLARRRGTAPTQRPGKTGPLGILKILYTKI